MYVFWDVDALHPFELDPRVVAAEAARLARCYGRPAGLSAYSVRKGWSWIPSFFLANYKVPPAGQRADARKPAAAAAGGSGQRDSRRGGGGANAHGEEAEGLACPACGMRMPSQQRLSEHVRRVHPGRTTSGAAAGAAAKRNTPGTTSIGNVAAYYTCSGELHRPPAGYQVTLKYVLRREGFDPRVVTNADEAIDRSMNGGIDKLLAALRAGRRAGERQVLLLLSDSGRHAAALQQCQALGVATAVVCSAGSAAEALSADARLDWGLLAGGEYDMQWG